MRILVMCKRQYTGRDLLDDQYGRLFEIPECLARNGEIVKGITLSYRKKSEGMIRHKCVEWHSLNGIPFSPISSYKHFQLIDSVIKSFSPDVIWVSSDAYQVLMASYVSKLHGIPLVVDLYDNYESFLMTKLPFLKKIFRRAYTSATGITVVTDMLRDFIFEKSTAALPEVCVIGNGINGDVFFPQDKIDSRSFLKLPIDAKLIGTAGALDASRGISTLLRAFEEIQKIRKDVWLVLAGPYDSELSSIKSDNFIYLGNLKSSLVKHIFNALDIAVICNQDSAFGRYCYPQKFDEINACGTLCLASAVGEMPKLLLHKPEHLFSVNSSSDLTEKILNLLENGGSQFKPSYWDQRAIELMAFIKKIT